MPSDEPDVTPPVAAKGRDPLYYWQAAISALSPEKQAAAWRFFHERELGVASGGTDTLAGFVILMEGHGLFMSDSVEKVAKMLAAFEARMQALPNSAGHGQASARAAAPTIPENIGPQANRIAALVQRLETAGGDSLTKLEKVTKAHEQAIEDHQQARRKSDVLFYVVTLVAVALLAAGAGYLFARLR